MSSSSEEDDNLYDDGDKMEEEKLTCLCCPLVLDETIIFLEHLKTVHGFDLLGFNLNNQLEFYDYIKLINYIRANQIPQEDIKDLLKSDYSDDKYLAPVIVDDAVLQLDLESFQSDKISYEKSIINSSNDQAAKMIMLESKLKTAEEYLERSVVDLNKCKDEMKVLLMSSVSKDSSIPDIDGNDVLNPNSNYFSSYSHHGIHEEMLKDTIRTESYRNYFYNNKDLFQDKIVLDIGCGTGILSLFAAKAGAKLVIGVDQSEIAYHAIANVRENDLTDKIIIMKNSAEAIKLPDNVKDIDIIISEWMGYFLLFEGMLDSVLKCRDKFGTSNTLICPDICQMYLVALSDMETNYNKIDYWSDVYGFKMNTMKKSVISEPLIQIVKANSVVSNSAMIKDLDLNKVRIPDANFENDFEFKFVKDCMFTSVCGYFDTIFSIGNPCTLSTSPLNPPTHWKQTVFLLDQPFNVSKGEILKCKITCDKNVTNPRDLDVVLSIQRYDETQSYQQKYCLC